MAKVRKLPGKKVRWQRRAAREDESGSFAERLERHRHKKKRMLIIALIICLVVSAGVHTYNKVKKYQKYVVKNEVQLDSKYNSYFLKFGDNVLKYSNDGAAYIDNKGEVWNQAYEIQNPLVDTCGKYAAIADQNTNDVYIFNTDKPQGKISMTYPIKKLEIASQGVIGAILEDKDASYIELRDKNGEVLTTGKSVISGEGYPVDFTMSEDGKKMAVSYLCITDGKIQSRLLFYNFDEVGKGEVDNMVGGFNYDDGTIIPKVEFINNDTVVAYGDNQINLYSMKEKPKKIWENKFDSEIKQVFYSTNTIGVVYYNSKDSNPYNAVVYDLKGSRKMDYHYDKEYQNVFIDQDNLVFYNENQVSVVTFAGRVKYTGDFSDGITEMVPTSRKYQYLVVTNNKLQEIRLK